MNKCITNKKVAFNTNSIILQYELAYKNSKQYIKVFNKTKILCLIAYSNAG